MFYDISPEMQVRMSHLEEQDAKERIDGVPRSRRLRQIPRETGRFLALLVAAAPEGEIVEIGTSGGYSTMWLALAGAESGRKIKTFEIDEMKIRLARETFRLAGIEDRVELTHGDALEYLKKLDNIAFCFLDAEKKDYAEAYDIVVPRLVPGGLLVADNVISHAEDLSAVVEKAEADPRIDSVVVPIGKGELVCRKPASA